VDTTALRVKDLSKRFRIYHERQDSLKATVVKGRRARYEDFWAVKDVSFEVSRGESFGIIGENGSGKSTLLKCLAKILVPESGAIETFGSLSALLELGAGFHPELSGKENIYLNGAILGLRKKQILAKFDEIVDFAGLAEFIDMPVKNYSSGMMAKLGFAIAINVQPDILVIDEVLAVGDEAFQRKCAEKINEFREQGRTIILVSHGLGQVRTLCDNALWLRRGLTKMMGPAPEVVDTYVSEVHGDRVTSEREGARWGSGEIRIVKIELLDDAGRTLQMTHTGDSVTFRLHYETAVRVEEPIFGFGIQTVEGLLVTGPNSGEYQASPASVDGRGTVDIRFPMLSLLEGTYDVSAGVTDKTLFHTYDHWQRPFRFDVVRGAPYEQHGMVTLHPEWRISARA
jgi:ABC-2 type transport system ATP-binding protein